jgi:hypothetical protein
VVTIEDIKVMEEKVNKLMTATKDK